MSEVKWLINGAPIHRYYGTADGGNWFIHGDLVK